MAKKKGKFFVMLERELLTCENYKQLSSSAKVIYTYARLEAGRQNKENLFSADFKFPYILIQKYTDISNPTIVSAMRELKNLGFLSENIAGQGRMTFYGLSLKWQDSSPIIKQKQTIRQNKQARASIYKPWGGVFERPESNTVAATG